MKNLIRKHSTFPLSQLPELKSFSFEYNGLKGYSGSIFNRPLKGGGPFSHYAFFLGFDNNNTLWMVENNEDGVECVSWSDFMSESSQFEFVHLEPDRSRFNEIMNRANERSFLDYSAHLNNCEHFANYCVLDDFKSNQADVMIKLTDKILSILELHIVHQNDPILHDSLHDYNEIRQRLQVKRGNEILEKKVNEKIKNL